MNGLDLLRWVLLIVGVAILVGVYFAGRRSIGARLRRRRAGRVDLPEIDAEAGTESLTVPDPELAELGRSIRIDESAEPSPDAEPAAPITVQRRRPKSTGAEPVRRTRGAEPPKPAPPQVEQKIVVVYVVAPAGLTFRGTDIFEAAHAAGMEHGEMRIFHHHEFVDGRPQSVFSMANMVEPGWFEQAERDQIQTPGVALFLQLPGPMEGVKAFDAMIHAAQTLKRELGGELRDASRSVMSHQTIAHLRDEISEYERLQRTRSGAH